MSLQNKVLIHGAVNSSNFGDVLFVKLFYEAVRKSGFQPIFLEKKPFGLSDFNKKEIGYSLSNCKIDEADILLFMSGGYFGDNNKKFFSSIKRWLRYFYIGLKFVKKNKKIFIMGVGGAPLYSWYNKLSARVIMNHATVVTVRDEDTKTYFEHLGVKKSIQLTADSALVICPEIIPKLQDDDQINGFIENKKAILLHLTGINELDKKIDEMIVPGLVRFLNYNNNVCVFLSFDNMVDRNIRDCKAYQSLKDYNPYIYNYHSASDFCALINRMDTIITTKLHVGIVGVALKKSVISFPMHLYKTKRFYQRISAEERCIPFDEINGELVYKMLEKFHGKPVYVPVKIRELAKKNLDFHTYMI